jgi:hypothetical protein
MCHLSVGIILSATKGGWVTRGGGGRIQACIMRHLPVGITLSATRNKVLACIFL